MNILIIYGSARKDSLNKAVAHSAPALAPAGMDMTVSGLPAFPLYDQDMETAFPAVVSEFKNKIRAADGIIVVTPEYNRSVPGVLKNVIDWTSRPYGDSAWDGKPVGILGATGGNVGTAVAQNHLKQIMNYLNAHVLGQPEFYMSGAAEKIANGEIIDEKTKEVLKKYLETFKTHVELFTSRS